MNESNENKTFVKNYILRQRLKKKREMETSISLEERKREEEMKRVKMKMSLAEVRLELQKLETKLSELKTQKHLLFSQLKKVLNEDVIRRRNRDLQWSADALFAAAELPPPAPPLGLPFAPPFAPNAFFRAQTSQPQYKPTFAATKAPPVVRKRSHEQTTTPTTGRQPHDERDYKSVTYTPQMGKMEFATNQSAYYGMMTSSGNRKYF